MPFVLDASATLPWCFEDEATPWSEAILDRLSAGEQALTATHWPVEVSNGLLMASRRKRIELDSALLFLERLTSLPIAVEPPLSVDQIKATFALCVKHNLTFYDGVYLELAGRTAMPLATLDEALRRAAPIEGVSLIG